MPLTTVTCPNCNTTLKPKTPVPEGTRLKCPKCATVFAAGADAVAPAPRPAPPPAPPPAADDEITDAVGDADDDTGAPPAAKVGAMDRLKKRVPLWAWFTLVGVASFFLGGCCCVPLNSFVVAPFYTGSLGGLTGGSVTKANYDKIKKGMTEAEVQAMLGAPSLTGELPGGLKSQTWKGSNGDFITVGYKDGKAMSALYQFTNGSAQMSGGGPLP